jgi:hypothetical protein
LDIDRVRIDPSPSAIPGSLFAFGLPGRIGAVLAAGVLIASAPVSAGECGTALLFRHRIKAQGAAPKSGSFFVTGNAGERARTLESDRFLINYSLRGLHKVRTGPEDSVLVRTADSLYAASASLPEDQRDSAVYARLDAAGAPQPTYVLKVREYFEAAWNYYVVTLKMKAPQSAIRSRYYSVPSSFPRKFPVDVVDIGTADPAFKGEIYGVTNPPGSLSIAFENDFLWATGLDAQGRIRGKDIQSRLDNVVLHDYAIEWELGVKVTAFHEFYHAVQFTYTPDVVDYHAWYELSAVGMEERNAPEVNDYLQYLPCVMHNPERVALTAVESDLCTHDPMYGQGIFHIYLSNALDSAFDVKVWDELGRNGNRLPTALETTFAKYGKPMSMLYSEYAEQLFFSGSRFRPPAGLFSPDMPLWPNLSLDSVDLSSAAHYRQITLPPTTFAALKIPAGAANTPDGNPREPKVMRVEGAPFVARIRANENASSIENVPETRFTLVPQEGSDAYYLIVANASFTQTVTVEVKEPEKVFYAFPNPLRSAASVTLYFSLTKGMAFPARVEILGENGTLVRSLSYADPEAALAWDLKDNQARAVKPGVYYYRLEKTALKPLVILR